ncbi:MAG: hydrolase 1, exosortase A system-associated [Massilia sp.]
MNYQELALQFGCAGETLIGVASIPEQPSSRGVLVVVGGPQYRAGSHRQFTLLARALASEGFPVLRFDYRGMGDSSGPMRDFEDVDTDLAAAIDQFYVTVPGLKEVVIWGLCDGASAAMFYAQHDPRVAGLVMLNPWARSEQGLAKSTLKHYYLARLRDPALWKKIASFKFNYAGALASMAGIARKAFGKDSAATPPGTPAARPSFHVRMCEGLGRFRGRGLFIISGADLTAKEFLDMAGGSHEWRGLLAAPSMTRQTLDAADHTFSRRAWRDQVATWTVQWLRAW